MNEFVVDDRSSQAKDCRPRRLYLYLCLWAEGRLWRALRGPGRLRCCFLAGSFSSGISKTISIRALTGSCCGPLKSTPLWLMFSMTPFVPGAGTVDAVAQRNVELQASRPWHPSGPFFARVAAAHGRFRLACSTRWVRRMVVQSYLYSAAQMRQT